MTDAENVYIYIYIYVDIYMICIWCLFSRRLAYRENAPGGEKELKNKAAKNLYFIFRLQFILLNVLVGCTNIL